MYPEDETQPENLVDEYPSTLDTEIGENDMHTEETTDACTPAE